MIHPNVYRGCAEEVEAQIASTRRLLARFRANENQDSVAACELEITMTPQGSRRALALAEELP